MKKAHNTDIDQNHTNVLSQAFHNEDETSTKSASSLSKLLFLAPLLSGILWGTSGTFVRTIAAMGLGTVEILLTRVSFATVVMLIITFVYDKKLLRIKLKDIWIFIIAGLVSTLGLNICYNITMQIMTLSFAAVLLSMAPVFVLILARIFFREKITSKKIVCMILALTGCALVSGAFDSISTVTLSVGGILIGFLSAFFYALYSIFSRLAFERGYHTLTILAYCFTMITIALIPFADWSLIADAFHADPGRFTAITIFHSLCVSILPYLLFTAAIRRMDTGIASILASSEPVAAMVFGLIFFDETPTFFSVIGMILTLIALGILSMSETKKS